MVEVLIHSAVLIIERFISRLQSITCEFLSIIAVQDNRHSTFFIFLSRLFLKEEVAYHNF